MTHSSRTHVSGHARRLGVCSSSCVLCSLAEQFLASCSKQHTDDSTKGHRCPWQRRWCGRRRRRRRERRWIRTNRQGNRRWDGRRFDPAVWLRTEQFPGAVSVAVDEKGARHDREGGADEQKEIEPRGWKRVQLRWWQGWRGRRWRSRWWERPGRKGEVWAAVVLQPIEEILHLWDDRGGHVGQLVHVAVGAELLGLAEAELGEYEEGGQDLHPNRRMLARRRRRSATQSLLFGRVDR